MSAHNPYFQTALADFVKRNHNELAALMSVSPQDISQYDLEQVLEGCAHEILSISFEFHGRFDQYALAEIALIPKSQRNLDFAAKLMARNEIANRMNKPLHQAHEARRPYGNVLGAMVDDWLTKRMRQTFRKIVDSSIEVEKRSRKLIAAMEAFKQDPSKENRVKVSVAVKSLNKGLVSSHYQAKAGAAWALRAGFSATAVTKGINQIYLKKMDRLVNSFERVDGWLGDRGIKTSIAAGIDRRRNIIERELVIAAGNREYNGLAKPQQKQAKYSIEGMQYAR